MRRIRPGGGEPGPHGRRPGQRFGPASFGGHRQRERRGKAQRGDRPLFALPALSCPGHSPYRRLYQLRGLGGPPGGRPMPPGRRPGPGRGALRLHGGVDAAACASGGLSTAEPPGMRRGRDRAPLPPGLPGGGGLCAGRGLRKPRPGLPPGRVSGRISHRGGIPGAHRVLRRRGGYPAHLRSPDPAVPGKHLLRVPAPGLRNAPHPPGAKRGLQGPGGPPGPGGNPGSPTGRRYPGGGPPAHAPVLSPGLFPAGLYAGRGLSAG